MRLNMATNFVWGYVPHCFDGRTVAHRISKKMAEAIYRKKLGNRQAGYMPVKWFPTIIEPLIPDEWFEKDDPDWDDSNIPVVDIEHVVHWANNIVLCSHQECEHSEFRGGTVLVRAWLQPGTTLPLSLESDEKKIDWTRFFAQ